RRSGFWRWWRTGWSTRRNGGTPGSRSGGSRSRGRCATTGWRSSTATAPPWGRRGSRARRGAARGRPGSGGVLPPLLCGGGVGGEGKFNRVGDVGSAVWEIERETSHDLPSLPEDEIQPSAWLVLVVLLHARRA